jgi:hypothetical protein
VTSHELFRDGESISTEVRLNGKARAEVRFYRPGTDEDLSVDRIDLLDARARERAIKGLPEDVHPEVRSQLESLSSEMFSLKQAEASSHAGRETSAAAAVPTIWPVPVEGPALLAEVLAALKHYIAFPSQEAAEAVALWALFTHLHDAVEFSILLIITSPTRGSGKTRVLEVLSYLVARPWKNLSPSDAVLFRKVHKDHPTLLLDEADNIAWADRAGLVAMLNGGFSKAGAVVPRCVGEGGSLDTFDFSVWCPKAIACIKTRLPDTTLSRSVIIPMQRRQRNEPVEKLRERQARAFLDPIRQRLARWATDHMSEVSTVEPTIPDALSDRAGDAWTPLLAIAEVVGGDWPERAERAALLLSGNDAEPQGLGERLLADIRQEFEERGDEKMFSADLAQALARLEGSPWSDWKGGKGFTPSALANQLAPFKISPRTTRIGSDTKKGYHRDSFINAWARYLPARGHPDTPNENKGLGHVTSSSHPAACDASGSESNLCSRNDCDGVTVQKASQEPPGKLERGDAWEPDGSRD